MRGIVFLGNEKVEVREFPEPKPGPGEVIVRIRASGMCGSDLHFYRRPAVEGPHTHVIEGHEPCGDVYAIGPGVESDLSIGDRVMVHHYRGCGECQDCRAGWQQMCSRVPVQTLSNEIDGGHAPLMRVAANMLVPLNPGLSYQAGAAIGCGTGTAWGALNRLGDIEDKPLVVLGQGPVGMSVTMLGARRGAEVIAVDVKPDRLAKAKRFGAAHTVDLGQQDIDEVVRDLTRGKGAPLVVEASGATPAVETAVRILEPWGKICLVGLGADVRFNTMETFRKQMTILTSWTLSAFDQARCADFVVQNNAPVDDIFDRSWSIDEAAEAYEWFNRQIDGKGYFEFGDELI